MKSVLFIVLLLLSAHVWGLECSSDNIFLDTQDKVDNFQTTYGGEGVCDTVTGYVLVTGSDITNIDGLAGLTSVILDLDIVDNAVLTNVDGLANLTSVGQDLGINNNPALINIDGLSRLIEVGPANNPHDLWEFSIHNNAVLTNIDGLSNLTTVNGRLNIGRNPALANLDGLASLTSVTRGLSIYGNTILTDLDSLTNLSSLEGELSVFGNKMLSNLDGLNNLTSLAGLSIAHNTTLPNLDGLAKLTGIGWRLRISNNPNLTNIDGLANLMSVRSEVGIYNNKALTNIDGLAALVSAGSLRIQNNAVLTNVDGLSSLNRLVEGLHIDSNSALTNIDGLSALSGYTRGIRIASNASLANVDGLTGLNRVGQLYIIENAALTNIDGLYNLTDLAGLVSIVGHHDPGMWDMIIHGNNALSSVDGLSRLVSVKSSARLTSNASLAFCTGLATLLDEVDDGAPGPGSSLSDFPDVGGDVMIEDNLESCNSIEEILDPSLNPPAEITATDGDFLKFVRVTFNLVPGASVYRVFRCPQNGETCGLPIGYPKNGSFNDRKAIPGTLYDYRVRACTTNACGGFSIADVGYATIPPDRPTGVRATDGTYTDRVQVSWNGVDGAIVYRVFRCLDRGQTCGSPIGFPQGTNFDDHKGAPNTRYFYRAKACTTQHCSRFSVADAGQNNLNLLTGYGRAPMFSASSQQVPIPGLNTFGRWLLILLTLGVGLVLLNRQKELIL